MICVIHAKEGRIFSPLLYFPSECAIILTEAPFSLQKTEAEKRVKEKQVKVLRDLVTVSREQGHYVTGKPGRRLMR